MTFTPTPENRVIIFDTTLRDGDQSPGFALATVEKIAMAQRLAAMGVDVIEAGFPASSELDFNAVKTIASTVEGPRIAALARAVDSDIDAAAAALADCAKPRIHTFIATSEAHMRDKLRKTPEQVLADIDHSVRRAVAAVGPKGDVEWSAEDASRSSIDFLCRAVKTAIDAGATTINLPDTVGYAQPNEYADMFKQVFAKVKPAPHIVFSAHVHNDLGLAVINSLAAIHAGVRQIECTIKGIGERAGNAQMEAVVGNFMIRPDANPFWTGIDARHMKPVADWHSKIIGEAPSMYPIVGDNAFAHASGIHQHGQKAGVYEIADPRSFGHEGSSFPLTRHSGEAGIMMVMEQQGIDIPEFQRRGFVQAFKQQASDILESRRVRIVPDHIAAQWARTYMARPAQASQKTSPAARVAVAPCLTYGN